MVTELRLYEDALANVRNDRNFHPVRQLVQPNDPLVREIASVLSQAEFPVEAAQDFINTFTSYEPEPGDIWRTPAELFDRKAGDCDDKAIALCSLLRNYLPAEEVFCAFGVWEHGVDEGHMWVVMRGEDGNDRVLESTAGSNHVLYGDYRLMAMFNDQYFFTYPEGVKEFNLYPVGGKDEYGEEAL